MQSTKQREEEALKGGIILGIALTIYHLMSGVPGKIILSVPAGIYSYLMPDDPTPVYSLLVVLALDWITGVGAAIKTKNVSSKVMMKGLGKLMVYVGFIVAAVHAGKSSELLSWVPSAVFAYIALTELASIIENAGKMGYKTRLLEFLYRFLKYNVKVPGLKDTMRIVKSKTEEVNGKEDNTE